MDSRKDPLPTGDFLERFDPSNISLDPTAFDFYADSLDGVPSPAPVSSAASPCPEDNESGKKNKVSFSAYVGGRAQEVAKRRNVIERLERARDNGVLHCSIPQLRDLSITQLSMFLRRSFKANPGLCDLLSSNVVHAIFEDADVKPEASTTDVVKEVLENLPDLSGDETEPEIGLDDLSNTEKIGEMPAATSILPDYYKERRELMESDQIIRNMMRRYKDRIDQLRASYSCLSFQFKQPDVTGNPEEDSNTCSRCRPLIGKVNRNIFEVQFDKHRSLNPEELTSKSDSIKNEIRSLSEFKNAQVDDEIENYLHELCTYPISIPVKHHSAFADVNRQQDVYGCPPDVVKEMSGFPFQLPPVNTSGRKRKSQMGSVANQSSDDEATNDNSNVLLLRVKANPKLKNPRRVGRPAKPLKTTPTVVVPKPVVDTRRVMPLKIKRAVFVQPPPTHATPETSSLWDQHEDQQDVKQQQPKPDDTLSTQSKDSSSSSDSSSSTDSSSPSTDDEDSEEFTATKESNEVTSPKTTTEDTAALMSISDVTTHLNADQESSGSESDSEGSDDEVDTSNNDRDKSGDGQSEEMSTSNVTAESSNARLDTSDAQEPSGSWFDSTAGPQPRNETDLPEQESDESLAKSVEIELAESSTSKEDIPASDLPHTADSSPTDESSIVSANNWAVMLRFVPPSSPPNQGDVKRMLEILDKARKVVVMTGAGVSTESGIPDYRSEKVGQYARTSHRPIQYQEFMSNEYWRRRYWTRNYVAWSRFSEAKPNQNHKTIASWEKSAKFGWLVTQNVDGLHSAAGSVRLTELHGSAKRVVCMTCKRRYPRDDIQSQMTLLNPHWTVSEIGELAPDGDVNIPDSALTNFRIPHCESCGERSILKTDVVFFGENVPLKDVDTCYDKLNSSDCLLVVGSSLMVMSGYRFVYHAGLRGIPVVIVNIGPTRGDPLADVKVSAISSQVLPLIPL